MKSYLGSVKWSYKILGVSNKASSSHDLGKEKYMTLKKKQVYGPPCDVVDSREDRASMEKKV